ncbi:ribonuclease T [Sphingomonas sp. RB3P16]|uniref:ribonuclease T2 family protein n=1 Tax=Parasphingomonas frigoris TaxID=3096163 RepID=UPI002FCB5FCB
MRGRLLVAAVVLGLPGVAGAQALRCSVPAAVPRPHPDLASASQPQRVLPIGSYTLALTWAPEYCHGKLRDAAAQFQCQSGNRFGFTLHGLWPDGVGKEWPQYCTSTALLPEALIRQHVCATPSPQLLQHEWAKHGTCMGTTPQAYFARSTGLYAKLGYPDMTALSRRPLTAGQLAAAFAKANPGVPADAVRVTANKKGWLDELWMCLDKSLAYRRCEANSGGLDANASVKVWRGRR